ncbi:hypothetical protein AB0C27_56025 [Nonomuraea sp. NPDC048882]|uniref:hypothetical protein n=1 Tax=Nonomuraea sp. NPDC048882 TaxID=3154347 RepID=UPI0034043BF6
MSDQHDGAAVGVRAQALECGVLGVGVEGGGGSSQMSRSASRWKPRDGDALPLAAGQLAAVFEAAVQQGPVAVGAGRR